MLVALGEPWAELAKTIQSYITCEGRKDMVRPRHLKLFAVLKQKCSANSPTLLNSLLHDIAQSMKKAQHVESVVSHHGLIWLIVSHSLTQQQRTKVSYLAYAVPLWLGFITDWHVAPLFDGRDSLSHCGGGRLTSSFLEWRVRPLFGKLCTEV